MEWKKVSLELCDLLDTYIVEFPSEKKMMFGCPAFFVNNNMFTGVFADSIFVRLTPGDRERLFAEFDDAAPFEPMKGRVMKEYAVLPEQIYKNPELLRKWLKISFDFAGTLPYKEPGKTKK
ncbi:TfoX/Sxy family protein [candidate division KSB1 bacterium]|nr:TfoX/Sxy family protein [candidate division KSB1 bacterium]